MEQIKRSLGLQVTKLKKIYHPDGDIYHAIKASDSSFVGFGEAYFTTIYKGHTKGWKKHSQMILNLVVPVGSVTFYIYDEQVEKTSYITLGVENYALLTVPSGYWLAFSGEGFGTNVVLNIANIAHDPAEATNLPLSTFPISGDNCENLVDRC